GVRAEALARRGEHAEAVALARAAVAIASGTDALLGHADARMALATALRAAGRVAEADEEEARAAGLWEAKGATRLVAHTRAAGRTMRRGAPARGTARRPVQPNFATEHARRLDAAFAARDPQALGGLFDDAFETVHHASGTTYGRDAAVERFASAIRGGEEVSLVHEALASFGDSLALFRVRFAADAFAAPALSVGEVELGLAVVIEAGDDARAQRSEIFRGERLADAVKRLYELHAERLPAGAARDRAAATARVLDLGSMAPDAVVRRVTPDVELVDHRSPGLPPIRGSEALARVLAAASETADDAVDRLDDVLAAEPDALLTRWTRARLLLGVFGADGRTERIELFGDDRRDDALARFEALAGARTADATPPRVAPNAATACAAAIVAAVAARDLAAVAARVAEPSRTLHHPSGASWGTEGALASWRVMIEGRDVHYDLVPHATAGDALGLFLQQARARGPASDDPGEYSMDHWLLLEVDATGRMAHAELFADDRYADALARLHERHAERATAATPPENAATRSEDAMVAAWRAQDWNALCAVFAPGFRSIDRRSLMHVETDLEHLLASFRPVFDMRVSRESRLLATRGERFALHRLRITGSDDVTGPSEVELLQVIEADEEGRRVVAVAFDAGDLGAAYAELNARYAAAHPQRAASVPAAAKGARTPAQSSNAATRALDRLGAAWRACSVEAIAALLAPGFRNLDRRALLANELDRDGFLASFGPLLMAETHVESAHEVLATRGERLALARAVDRVLPDGGSGDAGPLEIEILHVVEVDDAGRIATSVVFDPTDLDAAYAELDARYAAGEGAAFVRTAAAMRAFADAFARRDWAALAACCAPDLVVADHRRLGWAPLRGPEAYVNALRALVELASDTAMRLDHVETAERGFLVRTAWIGTREGGLFEEPSWIAGELDDAGRIRRIDQHDVAQEDEARRRFAAIAATDDPLRIPPNAAVRAMERFLERREADDRDGVRALCAPDCVWDDRRPATRLSGDRETFVASSRVIKASRARAERTLLAVNGDRLALHRVRFVGGDASAPFEIELLELVEVDAEGRIAAMLCFPPEDRRAAAVEMLGRSTRAGAEIRDVENLPIAIPPNAATRIWNGVPEIVAAGDWDALRALAAPGFRFEDRRRRALVAGDLDLYLRNLEFVRAWPGRRVAAELLASMGERVAVDRVRFFGGASGDAFEGEFLRITEVDARGRLRAVVHFDPDERRAAFADLAARFAAGEADGAEAQRVIASFDRAWASDDLAAARRCLADDLVVVDDTPAGIGALDGAAFLASLQEIPRMSRDVETELLWIAAWSDRGRVDVGRTHGTMPDGGGPFENPYVRVLVVAGDRIRHFEIYAIGELERALARFAALQQGKR
ncbi:MAG: hypothetical protein DCC71_22980, partial [Proteobacteria bacterium]